MTTEKSAVSVLREALTEAAAKFRYYEASHRAKNTDDSNAKAEVNAELAGRFEAIIAATERAAIQTAGEADARDAARYRLLRDGGNHDYRLAKRERSGLCLWQQLDGEALDRLMDKAMEDHANHWMTAAIATPPASPVQAKAAVEVRRGPSASDVIKMIRQQEAKAEQGRTYCRVCDMDVQRNCGHQTCPVFPAATEANSEASELPKQGSIGDDTAFVELARAYRKQPTGATYRAMCAYIDARQPVAAPSDSVLMPAQMTDAMRDAANVFVCDRSKLVQIYKALRSAAPVAQGEALTDAEHIEAMRQDRIGEAVAYYNLAWPHYATMSVLYHNGARIEKAEFEARAILAKRTGSGEL